MAQLQLIVVTPESTVLDTPAEFVALPLYDGEIGILPGRAPLIGRLGFGELRVVSGGQATRFYVDGGFVQVADNVVSVLTNHAVPQAALNAGVAREMLNAAMARRTDTDDALATRERLIRQARAQLHLAEQGAGSTTRSH